MDHIIISEIYAIAVTLTLVTGSICVLAQDWTLKPVHSHKVHDYKQ